MSKIYTLTTLLPALLLSVCLQAKPQAVLIDAEAFTETGGWVIDQQSAHILGSPYLLAHGAGKPVADAKTTVNLPHDGTWYAYVRTYNWTSPWYDKEGPGAFKLTVDGKEIGGVCGTAGDKWMWQYAGSFSGSTQAELALRDLTGFDGRCDLICLTDSRCDAASLPNDVKGLDRLRKKHNPGYLKVTEKSQYDLIVVGGGIAGISTAVSAARLGLKVALVHDRPVLGGNNSTEVRVRLGGGICQPPYPNLGNLIIEYGHEVSMSARPAANYMEWKKEDIIAKEPNLTLLRNCRAVSAKTKKGKIVSIDAMENTTGRLIRLSAPLFCDCTGDGNLGAMAGADFAMGRESASEYGEVSAPETADNHVNGATVQWQTVEKSEPCSFPEFNYGMKITEKSVCRDTEGRWSWETGWRKDMIDEVEQIRDLELLAIYSNWSYLKNHSSSAADFANRDLDWVQFILGKRESRRLLGDYILTEVDIDSKKQFADATVTSTWGIDLHRMSEKNHKYFPGQEFRASSKRKRVENFTVPYRCLYSRNVDNLFMAGRDISATHIALGATRLMRTNSMMGEVVGMAASICKSHKCLPRGVYENYLDELKALMTEGIGVKGLPNNQNFNTH